MKREIYTCDRCGHESNITMRNFRCSFGRPLGQNYPLNDLDTGHLCPECEAKWCEKFFNSMAAWIKGEE